MVECLARTNLSFDDTCLWVVKQLVAIEDKEQEYRSRNDGQLTLGHILIVNQAREFLVSEARKLIACHKEADDG